VAKNPKRTVKKAAANVHQTAARARTLGENIVTAGEMLKQTADVVDAMTQRAAERVESTTVTGKRASGRRKSRT
jgi:hypothetical protein